MMKSNVFPTEREKATELVNFLIGEHYTTSYYIAWILMRVQGKILMNNQSCKIIFLECLRAVGVAASPCYVCKEGMRLHPVGASIRESGRDIATKNKDEILSK